ncbi:unnamed protein product [Owenia fusiformis]|uniref:Uncharacterized protein n=1 Tax=Owenia fusiformis TaxID=6347 RepID=A0A8J1XVT9_OWEFU|nr:unnamed protein product [Owenia fusiformis]
MTTINLLLFVLLGLILATYTSANPTNRHNENLVLYVNAPQKCCTPYQWHANISRVERLTFKSNPLQFEVMGQMWFDGKNERTAVHAIVQNGHPEVVTMIQDFKANKHYTIHNTYKKCEVGPIVYPKPERCIPDDAEFLGEEILGESLKVNSWKAPFKGKTYDVKTHFTMTDTCIPVTSTMSGILSSPVGKVHMLRMTTTFNFKDGIKDFSIFDIPSYCNKEL